MDGVDTSQTLLTTRALAGGAEDVDKLSKTTELSSCLRQHNAPSRATKQARLDGGSGADVPIVLPLDH